MTFHFVGGLLYTIEISVFQTVGFREMEAITYCNSKCSDHFWFKVETRKMLEHLGTQNNNTQTLQTTDPNSAVPVLFKIARFQ
jgi:hypothetical protein